MDLDQVERKLRERLDALGPAPRAELLHVLMLPDFDRAERIGEFWGYPESRAFAELLIDCEEDRTLRAVLVGMLREANAGSRHAPRAAIHPGLRACADENIRVMDKPLRPPPHREEARRLTEALRTSDRPVWVAVREFLTKRGIDPEKSAVGEWDPEQSGEVGVFVAPDRTAFELEVEWSPSTIEVVSLTDLVDPDLRFAWGQGAFAATSLLEEETPTGIRPVDVLVEYLAHLNEDFRGLLTRPMPWAREDYWSVLVTHLRDHSIDPSTAVVLHWGRVARKWMEACWTPRAGAFTSPAAL